jgi:demethylmenaquinone methyltransferase/2-methoxy-6-polyprenyl-1,4-benzoquinol methylase
MHRPILSDVPHPPRFPSRTIKAYHLPQVSARAKGSSVGKDDAPARIEDVAPVLSEQRDYYEARAPEYDEWWQRRGRYDYGAEANARWFAEVRQAQDAIRRSDLRGDVLELAAGTGNWTEILARSADTITALDASPEMVRINRERLAAAGLADRVSFRLVDLFAWQPERTYDAAFVGFFLSHVPEDRLDAFLTALALAVRPGGTVCFVDSRRDPTSSTPDQPLPPPDTPVMTRRLNDGRQFQIVKIYRSAEAMRDAFARHGIALEVKETPAFFQYGCGTASPPL